MPKPVLRGRVYALGDCAEITTQPLPPTAQVAEQQAYPNPNPNPDPNPNPTLTLTLTQTLTLTLT